METCENGRQDEAFGCDQHHESETERLQKKLSQTEEKLVKFKEFVVKLRNERTSLHKELQDEKSKTCKLQSEIDKYNNKSYQQLFQNFQNLQSEYDRYQDDNEKLKKSNRKLENDLVKCAEELVNHKEKCATQQDEMQGLHNQVNAKQSQIDELVGANKELESRIIVLETDLKNEKKKSSALPSLESQIVKLKDENKQKEDQIYQLVTQISELESKLNDYDDCLADKQQLASELQSLRDEHTHLLEQNAINLSTISQQTTQIESHKAQVQDVQARLSSLLKLNEEVKLTSSTKISSLEMIVQQLEAKLKLTEEDLKLNQAQFEEYQLKVSNVLKGSKANNLDYEKVIENLNFRVNSLEEENNLCKSKLDSAQSECEKMAKERDVYKCQLDNIEARIIDLDHLQSRVKQLEVENDELRARMRSLTCSLTAEKNKILEDSNTRLESVKQCYEAQINKLQEDMSSLRLHSEDTSSIINSNLSSDEVKDDHSFGYSETKAEKNFLEEILNGDVKANDASWNTRGPDLDNLTQLLKESENNINLMTEQNRVLKDEIRRLHRSIEKIDTNNNLEYLRNVLLKFITIKGASERERLITVLATMLKFNEEEVKLVHELVAEDGRSNSNGTSSKWSLW